MRKACSGRVRGLEKRLLVSFVCRRLATLWKPRPPVGSTKGAGNRSYTKIMAREAQNTLELREISEEVRLLFDR